MGLEQVEEKSNEGFSCVWGGDKCAGGWGQARKNGEAELLVQGWEEEWAMQLGDFQSKGYPRVGLQLRDTWS